MEAPKAFGPPILGKGSNMNKPADADADEPELSEEELEAAKMVKEAHESGSDEAYAMALKNFHSICGGY